MKSLPILFLLISTLTFSQALQTPFEKGNDNQTTTFEEMRKFYQELSKQYPSISYETKGEDDNGAPIDVVIFNPTKQSFEDARKGKSVLFVNNGIHPGEPDGIDATMMLMRDLATGKVKAPKNVIFTAIASYNISGVMNRGSFSRANQNGPEAYGFRGNARNYDLNRDFIKIDSKNSRSFQQIFQWLKPDVFIDNHVSNGADYQYTFTYISTNKERLGNVLGNYFNDEMQKTLLKNMARKGVISVPYVNIHGDVPDGGFPAFMDSPRYATGYTTLFNSIGTVVETHMLKPYRDRVKVTYDYMVDNLNYVDENYKTIQQKRSENLKQYKVGNQSTIAVEQYRIKDFKTVTNPYEGHYLHYETFVTKDSGKIKFRAGDFLVPLNQDGVKFLLETLEPEAVDSYFNWNFFDAILGQKEYYSAYVFEDTAAKLLKDNKALKTAFEMEKAINPKFAEDGQAQLDWVYKYSEYYEKTHRLYPVFRIN